MRPEIYCIKNKVSGSSYYRVREIEEAWICHDATRIKPESSQYTIRKKNSFPRMNDRFCLAHYGINGSSDENGKDVLSHHGVKGMHWGEITKEYQPVAVDHRKTRGGMFSRNGNLRTGSNSKVSGTTRMAGTTSRSNSYGNVRSGSQGGLITRARSRIQNQIDQDNAEVAKEREDRKARWKQNSEAVNKAMKYAAAAGTLLLIYGGYKYFKATHLPGTKTGLLKNLLKSSVSPYGFGATLVAKRKQNGVKEPEFVQKVSNKVKTIGTDFVKSVAEYRNKRRKNGQLGGLRL